MELKTFFQNVDTVAKLTRAINNPMRKKILRYLHDYPGIPVGKLARRIKLTPAGTSIHLAVLRNAGLVQTERDGRTVSYSLAERRLKQIEAAAGKMAGSSIQ